MNDASPWRTRFGQAALVIGLGMAAMGASAGNAEAAMVVPAPNAVPAASLGIQPIYWAVDRFGRRVWVEPRYRPPPPRYYHPPRRHGWVDRYGRWHPYR